MAKLKSQNYISIQAWMTLPPYNLKGNDLLIYAIIYGFCQIYGQVFNGSIDYLVQWTNSTRPGVKKNLNNLVTRGLITKVVSSPTNIYYINNQDITYEEDPNSVDEDTQQSYEEDTQPSLDNNIDNNINNKDKFKQSLEISSKTEEIISYLNEVCGTQFRTDSAQSRKLVKARLREGFSLEDFKKVIECKYEAWGRNPIQFRNGQMSNTYLRPHTLFGNKFESYVYESQAKEESSVYVSKSVPIDPDRSEFCF